ncbi:MAG: hypothetical protein AAGB24_13040 [Bacteroidota bacterium]
MVKLQFATPMVFIIMLLCFGMKAQCIGPLANATEIRANPNDINGNFRFNYRIESHINYEIPDEVGQLRGDYFVNTTDGSLFFHKGFLLNNFKRMYSGDNRLDAAIMMPNGKIVLYVYDIANDQKRALELATNLTAGDRALEQFFGLQRFYNESLELRAVPARKPSSVRWKTRAYAVDIPQPGRRADKFTVHFAENPSIGTIKTSVPMVGLFVGIFKDFAYRNCNRLAVHTEYESSKGLLQAELKGVEKKSRTFDASEYKRMTLSHDILVPDASGMTKEESEEMLRDIDDFQTSFNQLMEEAKRCGDDEACQNRIGKKITQLQMKFQGDVFGAPGSAGSGREGSDFARRRLDVQEQIDLLTMQSLEQQEECEELNQRRLDCRGGCEAEKQALKVCQEKVEDMSDQMNHLHCQMGRLMGVEDFMEDCK